MRVPSEQRLSKWLVSHLRNLQLWTDPQTGRVFDPFESHEHDTCTLAESYSPATALVAAALAARYGLGQVAPLVPVLCKRIVERLADHSLPPSTALALRYFALLAAADLKILAEQPNPPVTEPKVREFITTLCAHQYQEPPVHTNHAAMHAGICMLRHLHGGQADWSRCKQYLDIITSRQGSGGLVTNAPSGRSVSIAGHMFCMYILAAAMCRLDLQNLPETAGESIRAADAIVTGGYAWLGHLLANDGMFAQCGPGRYHAFSQAAGAALLAAIGIEPEDAAVRRYLAWMDQYRLEEPLVDEPPGSAFAVTPNLCPPALRVGFEPDALLTAQNNLAMTILLDAWTWWTTARQPIPSAAEARRIFFNTARDRGSHGDEAAGLLRLRSRAGYALVGLPTNPQGTIPPGSLMHLRLGDDLHEKATTPPFWAEPVFPAEQPEQSVCEGPMLANDARQDYHHIQPAPFVIQGRVLHSQSTPSTAVLQCQGPGAEWTKTIVLEPRRLQLHWHVRWTQTGGRLYAAVPCLLWNGMDQTHLQFEGAQIRATLADQAWRMTIMDSQGQPHKGDWLLTPSRGTLSISGVTGRLLFLLHESATAGESIEWMIRIEAEL